MTPAQSKNFDRLLSPRQIAFVGGDDAAIAIGEARRRGYSGEIWAVNPRRRDLAGVPCFHSLEDLPGPPDAVFLAIPAVAAVEAVARLAEMGAGGVACYSAGFKEADAAGARLEVRLHEAAGDLALVGPNCYGVINYVGGVALWPFAHGGECPGYGAAIITQSGMLSSDITMAQRSLPLAYMVSAGNQTVLGLADFVEAFAKKPAVRAIGLHIEGLTDIPHFERAALAALQAGKPLVVLKTGTSRIGSELALSHTGSLSGTRELYEALFRRLGVISVTSPTQLLETLKFLCVVGAPEGSQLVGFTGSGGGAAMLADHAEAIGLTFPAFDPGAENDLERLLPPIATVSNPLDYTTPIWGQSEHTGPVFARAMARPDIDAALLVQDYPAEGLDESVSFYVSDASAFAEAAAARGVPAAICATLPENMGAHVRASLISQGIAPMQGIHEALNAIQHGAHWSAERRRILEEMPPPLEAMRSARPAVLRDEAVGKAWLREHGVPVPLGVVATGAEAPKAAGTLGFPVALKLLSTEIVHKTEAGTVAVGLNDKAAVERAVADMRDALAGHNTALPDRFLVERMEPPPVAELLVGIRRDPQFGYSLTLGSGGVLAELVGDAETVLLPATGTEIASALGRLRVAALLRGYRGRSGADVPALVAMLEALTQSVLAQGTSVEEIEINPLFVHRRGVCAVDAVMRTVDDGQASAEPPRSVINQFQTPAT